MYLVGWNAAGNDVQARDLEVTEHNDVTPFDYDGEYSRSASDALVSPRSLAPQHYIKNHLFCFIHSQ